MKKFLSLVALVVMTMGVSAQTKTLFTTNFSTDDGWVSESIFTEGAAQTATATRTIKGVEILFEGYKTSDLKVVVGEKSSDNGTLTFTGNNLSASKGVAHYYMAIPLAGVNGSITVSWTGDKYGAYYSYKDGDKTIADRVQAENGREFIINDLESSDIILYLGQKQKSITSLTITTPTIAIEPAQEWTTYVTTKALDFTGVEGLTAYAATAATATSVTLTEVGAVPEGTPLVLKKGSETTYNVPVAAEATALEKNLLVAGDGSTTIGGEGVYVLSDGAFHPLSAPGVLPVGKAYLKTSASAPVLSIIFDGDGQTTGISSLNAEKAVKGEVYDLQGRRVQNPTKGLYIVGGKKVVLK